MNGENHKLPSLSAFFPVYNEQENIRISVDNAYQIFPACTDALEVIVVNDGSSDNTAQVLDELCAAYDSLRVVTHPRNRGYGAALRSGFSAARNEYVFFTDGDCQFDLNDIRKLIPLALESDMALGFRDPRRDHFMRIVNGKAYNMLVRILFGLKVKDIDCAFKIIRKKVLDAVELKSESQFVSAEFLIKATKKGFTVKERGVTHLPREKGRATGNSLWAIFTSFAELFKLWQELRQSGI